MNKRYKVGRNPRGLWGVIDTYKIKDNFAPWGKEEFDLAIEWAIGLNENLRNRHHLYWIDFESTWPA